jgi:hypothetical protein
MAHQHFYIPDYLELPRAQGVASVVKLGPGRKRATGGITLTHPTVSPLIEGQTVTVVSHTGTTRVFTFSYLNPLPANGATTRHVFVDSNHDQTIQNLFVAMFAEINPTNFPIHPRIGGGHSISLRYRFHGTVGNGASVTESTGGTSIVAVDLAGGLDTNATAGVRPWNYLAYGSNSSSQDTYNDWHARQINEDTLVPALVADMAYHSWDWPHMSRMNEVTRDGWWLYFDPLAHDSITGLMHLATQCFSRYPEARADESPYIGTGADTATQLAAATAYSNLALIREGHNNQYLLRMVQNQLLENVYPRATFLSAVSATGGLNCGTWATRNPQLASNPQSQFDFVRPGDWPIDRGWGWGMATVARGYAISAAHRLTASKDVERERLHPPGVVGIPTSGRVSWFEMMRECIKNTMHASGAVSSSDTNSGSPNPYDVGPIDFDNRKGSIPGGELNIAPGGATAPGQDDWYPNVIAWHTHFVAIGAYAILKRVYSWVDRDTVPTANPWLTDLGKLWRFGLQLFRYAKSVQGGAHFFVPTFSLASVGDYTTGRSEYGRFNPQTGADNPLSTANYPRMFWWSYGYPIPGTFGTPPDTHAQNFYYRQYLMWSWMLWRIERSADVVDIHPGLLGQGGGVIADRAVAVVQALKLEWEEARGDFSAERYADQCAWAIQWHRNEFVPPSTIPLP